MATLLLTMFDLVGTILSIFGYSTNITAVYYKALKGLKVTLLPYLHPHTRGETTHNMRITLTIVNVGDVPENGIVAPGN